MQSRNVGVGLALPGVPHGECGTRGRQAVPLHLARTGREFYCHNYRRKRERIPLTIYDWDKDKGIVYMIFQEIGASTIKLGKMKKGDSVFAIAGPLGRHFHIERYGNAVIIGGGVRVPAIFQ